MNLESIKKLKVAELQAELQVLNLDITGTKPVLIERLAQALNLDNSESEQKPESGSEIEAGEIKSSHTVEQKTKSETMSNFSGKDVEHLLTEFSGEDNYSVETWLSEFEEIATLVNWTDVEKIIYARRKMVGPARVFMRTCKYTTFAQLKEQLLSEFKKTICKADIYDKLQKTKKARNESFREYVYKMQEIGQLADVDEKSIIHYIINGIPGREEHKIILYGAESLSELKSKYEGFEKFKSNLYEKSGFMNGKSRNNFGAASNSKITEPRCFNCGSKEHKRKDCRNEVKCFKCNGTGHMSGSCPVKSEKMHNGINTVSILNSKAMFINNTPFQALIDTGAEITLMKYQSLKKLKNFSINKQKIDLVGLGQGRTTTLGTFRGSIEVDDVMLETEIMVVPDNAIRFDLVIGIDIISQAKVVFDNSGPKFYKLADEPHIMQIQIADNTEVDVPHAFEHKIKELINNYKPIRSESSPIEMTIILNDESPIYCQPRRFSNTEKEAIRNQTEIWLKDGIIRPSTSAFSSQVVVVRKKDGTPRICIDYRKLNSRTIAEHFPVPLIEDIIDNLKDAKVFTTLDLKNGYFHVPVEESSKKYTSFVVSDGQFEFNRVPFGLANAPAVFLRFISVVFRELVNKGILDIYMDDMIVAAKDEVENLEKLGMVFKVASENGIEFNWGKCRFLKREVQFLGHIISEGIIKPAEDKVKAVKNFPEPTNIKGLQSFLGLTGFFRRFINSYSILAKPLTDLLKKNRNFVISNTERQAITALKEALTTNPVLKIYNKDADTEIHTDACQIGIAAILMQKSEDGKFHPVQYYSRKNTPTEQKWHSYVLEAYAVYKAIEKFRIYVQGMKFKVVTDCAAFRQTLSKKDLPNAVQRWVMYLQEYNFEIEHRSAKKMIHVDSLSRTPIIQTVQQELIARIKRAQEADEFITSVKEVLKKNPSYGNFIEKRGILLKEQNGFQLVVVPRNMEKEIIKIKHEEGHFSMQKTELLVAKEFYIPRLKEKIQNCINNCVKCILANRKAGKQEGFLHCLDKGEKPLETYHLDHIGPMNTTTKEYKYILTIVCGFSKYTWLYPTKTLSTEEVIKKLEQQQQYFGNPKNIITDRGSCFTAKQFEDYCEKENINHIKITAGVPRANGQAERQNRVVLEVLTRLSIDSPEKWYKLVPRVQMAINSSFQRAINKTPFEVLFGVTMRKKEDLDIIQLLQMETLRIHEEDREKTRQDVRQQILKIQEENRKSYNKHCKAERKYEIGDLIAIKRTQFTAGNKLVTNYLGPYEVVSAGRKGRYTVRKVTQGEGPKNTTTSVDNMKPWRAEFSEDEQDLQSSSGPDDNIRMAECGRDTRSK